MGIVGHGTKKIACLCAVLWAMPLWGQSSAEVGGRVVDASHHPLVSVFVIITAQDTMLMRAATTDESGEFEFLSLPVGSYNLRVVADGFLPFF